MSNNFVNIAHKEFQRQMAREMRYNPEEMEQEIRRLREIIAHQEAKIGYLYAELNKSNANMESRERACREKEEKLSMALLKFEAFREKISGMAGKVNRDGGPGEKVPAREPAQQPESGPIPVKAETATGSSAEVRELAQQIQVLAKVVHSTLQIVKALENRGSGRSLGSEQALVAEENNNGRTQNIDVPLGYTADANSSQIYLRGEAISFDQEIRAAATKDPRLDPLLDNICTVRQRFQEINKTVKREIPGLRAEKNTGSPGLRTEKNNNSPDSKTITKDILFACDELQNFLDLDK